MSAIDYRDFWTVPVEDVPAKTGADGVMDCADILDVLEHLDLTLGEKTVLDVGDECSHGVFTLNGFAVSGQWSAPKPCHPPA